MTLTQHRKLRLLACLGGLSLLATTGVALAQDGGRLAAADRNGDGAIEWQEVVDMRATGFERMDRNSDGVVNLDDRPRFGPGKVRFTEAFEELAANADADGDGSISKAEMLEAPAPRFTTADVNEDGVLSAEEIESLQ
ncbi:MAG: hypothetical protein AAGL90_15740 [Pseudomonadota bacterium]